jgi:hypothetical protein
MDIYAKPGTKVRYSGKNGYGFEHKKFLDDGIEIGAIFTIRNVEIGQSKSYVSFEEIDGKYNTVIFEEIKDHYDEILDFEHPFSDCSATTLREYFHELLETLWTEGEGFSGKRPFGNSGWEYDVYAALIHAGAIEGELNEDGYVEKCNDEEAASFVFKLIDHIFKGNRNGN